MAKNGKFVNTKVRAERFLTLAHECRGKGTNYSEDFGERGSIVRLKLENPQIFPKIYKGKYTKLTEDCTSDIVGLAYAAGLVDPGGTNYRTIANTTLLETNLEHCHPSDVRPGDLITYHASHSQHGVLVLSGHGLTAEVYSFGHPPCPVIERADYRKDVYTGLIYMSRVLGFRK